MASCNASLASQPLKVYILAGQSNMQGHAHFSGIPYLGLDPETAPVLDQIFEGNSSDAAELCKKHEKPKFKECENIWISVVGLDRVGDDVERHGKLSVGYGANADKIGPELSFGLYLQEKESATEPILIIKTAWGGRSLNTDFRPPSAGIFQYSEESMNDWERHNKDPNKTVADMQEEKRIASGHYYKLMMEHIRHILSDIPRVCPTYNPDLGYELKGFFWFQGWNDVVDRSVYRERDRPGGYDEYGRLLSLFIQDVRSELAVPTLPFVIGVLGVGGFHEENSLHGRFRKAMELPVEKDKLENVVAVRTEDFWDAELEELDQKWAQLQRKLRTSREEKAFESKEEEKEAFDAWTNEEFSPEDLEKYRLGRSNFGFHYHGNSQFFVKAGKAFAEAIHKFSA